MRNGSAGWPGDTCFGALPLRYDPTIHATLREWRPAMTINDLAWGACSWGIGAKIASTTGCA
jgi:uncharacterized membrane protein